MYGVGQTGQQTAEIDGIFFFFFKFEFEKLEFEKLVAFCYITLWDKQLTRTHTHGAKRGR
jgi:hypothetical protein